MKVILIGYRAAGKTTVGKLLAMLLKVPFYDSDSVVEEIVNSPVRNIVAHHGWEYFRKKETEAIQLLSEKGDCVIATGGGVVLNAENVKLLKQMGVIAWLNAPIKDIIDRLNEDAQNMQRGRNLQQMILPRKLWTFLLSGCLYIKSLLILW